MAEQLRSALSPDARSSLASYEYFAGAFPAAKLRVLRGRHAILALQPVLADLAARCDLAGEADNLAYFLSTPEALKKTPYLLLAGDSEHRPASAVLVFEHRLGLLASRVFTTADISGRRSVLAAPEHRAQTAAFAARTLLERSAHMVHITFSETHSGARLAHPESDSQRTAEAQIALELRPTGGRSRREWTFAEREIPLYLPLRETYDQTLARIGKRTRTHLRYYRRRSELDLGATFVPDARLTLKEFLAFNRECMYAVPKELAAWRYCSFAKLSGGVLRGVRDDQGRWLSLVGMRRQNQFAEIDWQMNRNALPTYSLSTVMRSYLIEHEIAEGSTRLYFEGGTWQPIVHSFANERLGELSVRRGSRYARLLARYAHRVFPRRNHLGQTLANRDISWKAF